MKEIKICLPPYKMICAFFFIFILALVRGISAVDEIGPTIDTYIALLTLVLCADTCYQEIPGGAWEILAIKPGKIQRRTIMRRFAVQFVFLIWVAAAGYGMFYLVQHPYIAGKEPNRFLTAMAATAASIVMFEAVPVFFTKVTGSLWGSVGASAVLWFFLISSNAVKLPAFLQIFAFGGSTMEAGDMSWLSGKAAALVIGAVCIWAVGDFGRHTVRKKKWVWEGYKERV